MSAKNDNIETVHWVFFLLIATVPLIKSINLPFIGKRLAIFEFIFVMLTFLFVARIFRQNQFEVVIPIETIPLSILIVITAVALQNTYSMRLGLLNLIVLIYYFILLTISIQLLEGYTKVYYAINTYILTSMVVIFTGLIGMWAIFFDVSMMFVEPISGRVIATFREPNQLPAFLVTSFPLLALHPKRKISSLHNVIFNLFALLCMTVVISSGSDWGFAILLIESSIILIYKLYTNDYFFETIFIGCSTALLLIGGIFLAKSGVISLPSSIRSSFSLFMINDISINSIIGGPRYKQFFVGFPEAIKSHPLVGIGLGTFGSFMVHHFSGGGSMHNTFLGVIAGTGFMGGVSFFSFFYFIVKRTLYNLRNPINEAWFELAVAIATSLIGILLFQLAHYGLRWRHLWLLFVFTIAIGRVNNQESEKSKVGTPE